MRARWTLRQCAAFLALSLCWLAVMVLGVGCELAASAASWGPRGCAPQGAVAPLALRQLPAPARAAVPDGWKVHPQKACQYVLWQGGKAAGLWCSERHQFWPWDADTGAWGAACTPPVAVPAGAPAGACAWCQEAPEDPVRLNFGLNPDKLLHDGEERYSVNGRPVTRDRVREALEAGGLEDDSKKLRLTLIGPEADRKQVLADLEAHPSLRPLRPGLLVQAYPPDHWAVKDAGFLTTGKPTIYVQAPSGKVLHRQDGYRGPEKMAEAIRKADPNYNPARDPDLNRQVTPPVPDIDLSKLPRWAWTLAGGAGVLLLLFLLNHRNKVTHGA
jgi:hypothetical protein